MSKLLELQEKRANIWEQAKAFLDEKQAAGDTLSTEDAATYDKMEADVMALGKEIDRLKTQAAIHLELRKTMVADLESYRQPACKAGCN